MSTDLVPFSIDDLPVVTDEELGALANVSSGRKYLSRLQLAASSCDLCKTGKCKPGVWVIPNGSECKTIGESIDVLPLAVRNKAVDMNDKKNIITSYDKDSEEFARIQATKKRVYWGQSFMVIERTTGELYELYFGNASGREESDKMKPFLGRPDRKPQTATVNVKYHEGKEFSWHVPVIVKCSDPITSGPDIATIVAEKKKFMNPPVSEVEVEEVSTGRAR